MRRSIVGLAMLLVLLFNARYGEALAAVFVHEGFDDGIPPDWTITGSSSITATE